MKLKFWPLRLKVTLIFFLFLGGLVIGRIWHLWERIHETTVQIWEPALNTDCAVVLTGGRGRIKAGLTLLRRNQIETLIISGVYPDTKISDIIQWQDLLLNQGGEGLVLERQSRSTFGNAQQSWPLLKSHNCSSFYLITSQLHMYRALKTFEAQQIEGIEMIPRANPTHFLESRWHHRWTEVIKTFFYSLWAF